MEGALVSGSCALCFEILLLQSEINKIKNNNLKIL